MDPNYVLSQLLQERGERIHDQAVVDLEEETKRIQAERELLANTNPTSADVLTLNLGGREKIKVTRQLMTKVEGSKMQEVFADTRTLP